MSRRPWNRLWVQFSLSFSALVIIAAAVFVFTTFIFRPEPVDRHPPNESPQTELTQPPPNFQPPPDDEPPPEFRNRAQDFITQSFLILSATGAILGIVAGIWMARRIALPLEELSDTARAIGAHNLDVRATEQGTYEMVSLAKSFNQMAEDLQEEQRLRQNMLSDVAHELRTPLTVLQANLRAILDDVYTLDKAEVARLYDQTLHLSRLVSDLRMLSQAEANQLPLDLRPVNVVDILLEAGDIFEPVANEDGITLNTSVPDSAVMVEVDRARITQVVQNLLANSLRHTPEGGTITLELSEDGTETPLANRQVRIVVRDTGAGIAQEQLSQVFGRFYRADRARARDSGGVGLGLAISRALVEAHGGTISAYSEGLGKGSTFTVCLPLSKPERSVPA